MPKIIAFKSSERFDLHDAKCILDNWDKIQMPEDAKQPWEVNGKSYDPRSILGEYIAASRQDNSKPYAVKKTTYSFSATRKTVGRRFVDGSLGMQSMSRFIRHTIAHKLYHDIDVVNCHPNILEQYCNKRGWACDAISYYNNHRDECLQELMGFGLEKEDAKRLLLCPINNGYTLYMKFREEHTPPEWLRSFIKQIPKIHELMMKDPTNAKLIRLLGGANRDNLEGSLCNHIMCEIEDDILMACIDYVKSLGLSVEEVVLAFDGFQLLKEVKEEIDDEFLDNISKYVKTKTDYDMKFMVKPMTCVINLEGLSPKIEKKSGIIIRDDENESSSVFLDMVKDVVKYSKGRVFVRLDNGIWTENKNEVDRFLIDKALSANFYKIVEGTGKVNTYSAKLSCAKAIVEAMKFRIENSPLFADDLWWSNKGKLVWSNGYYDFNAKHFVDGYDGCSSTIAIPRPFPKRDEALIQEVYDRVIDPIWGKDLKTPFLQFMARALAGYCEDKAWGVMMGERNCGKGVLGVLCQNAFGDYFGTVPSEVFLQERVRSLGDEAKKMSWALAIAFKRIIFTNEMTLNEGDNLKINGNIIKKIASGGDTMMGRCNYKDEVEFKVQGTLMMCCNDLPPVSPADAYETMVPFDCPHKFVRDLTDDMAQKHPFLKRADESIKQFCRRPEVGDAFFWIVADHFLPCPVQLTEPMNEFKSQFVQEDEVAVLFKYFTITKNEDDKIHSSMVSNVLKQLRLNITPQRFSQIVTKRGARASNNVTIDGKKGRGFYGLVYMDMEGDEDE